MNTKIGVSTWLWSSPFTTESVSLFEKIKSMGFDAVEIPVEYPELIDATVVKEALERYQLEPVVCGAFGPTRDFTHADPAVHQNCFQYIFDCFALCNAWNAKFLAGPMYSAVGKARMLPPSQRKAEWELAVKNLRLVCQRAQEHGLMIALEPLNRFESDLVNTAADVMRMVQDIDHPAANVLLDSFHMGLEEVNLEHAIETVGSRLIHVQVSENHRGIPGSGLTPWDSFKKGLEKARYKGVVSIESFTPEVKELAGAVSIWRTFARTQDQFASEGKKFLNELLNG